MEDKYKGEQVLVFDRALLDELGAFQGYSLEPERYLDTILDKSNNRFHVRFQAETDESLKQIIPYVMFVHGDSVFSYIRGKQAGESRLVGNRSVGIGGHVNPVDDVLFSGAEVATDRTSYLEAVNREIAEEVIVDGDFDPEVVALINDDSNPVGRVHFGVVHVCEIDHRGVSKREQQITRAGFVPIAELAGPRREELETWSALAVDLLIERGRP
jgi:predicted NUDIX family phosphoesterase